MGEVNFSPVGINPLAGHLLARPLRVLQSSTLVVIMPGDNNTEVYIMPEPLFKSAADMDTDDLEFLQAVDEFRRTRNQFPRLTDYLALLRGLGWRKVLVDTTCQTDSKIGV